jgi:hypothetical protein
VGNFGQPVPLFQMNYRGPSPGSLLSFAINDGYPEGILRGFKLGLLGQADYANLSQCDVIDGTLPFDLAFQGGAHRNSRRWSGLGDEEERGGQERQWTLERSILETHGHTSENFSKGARSFASFSLLLHLLVGDRIPSDSPRCHLRLALDNA